MDKQTNRIQKWFHPDVPSSVRSHLLGENHTPRHKFVFGTLIMFAGVTMVKVLSPTVESVIFHIITDVIGYGLHAIGAIPIIKSIDKGGTL